MSITKWESKNLSNIEESSAEFAEILHEAHNGNSRAQHTLGMWYEIHGELEEAEEWYKNAADQGHEGARQALDELRHS